MAFNFKKKIKEFEQLKKSLPLVVGNMAKRHFVKSFRDGGFTDKTLDPWQKRKTRNRSDRRNPRAGRALLVDTGHMRRSVKIKSASFSSVKIGTNIPYAKYHNNPKKARVHRQFIGNSQKLNNDILRRVRKDVKSIF